MPIARGAWLPLVPVTESNCSPPPPSPHPPPPPSCAFPALPPSSSPSPPSPSALSSAARPRPFLSRLNRQSRGHKSLVVPLLPMPPDPAGAHPFCSAFQIRPLQVADLSLVQSLHAATLPVTYSSSYFLSLLSDPAHRCLVATLPPSRSPGTSPDRLAARGAHAPGVVRTTSALSGCKRVSREVIGCVSARRLEAGEEGAGGPPGGGIRLLTLCVAAGSRRSGVARSLLEAVVAALAPPPDSHPHLSTPAGSSPRPPERGGLKVSLHVQAPNRGAQAFYERQGFSKVRCKRGYYAGLKLKTLDPALKGEVSAADQRQITTRQAVERDVDAWYMEATR